MATYSLFMSEVSFEEVFVQPDGQGHPPETYWELQGATIEQIVQHPRYLAAQYIELNQVSFTPTTYQFPPTARNLVLKYCNVPGPFVFPAGLQSLTIEGMNLGFPLILPPTLISLFLNICDLVEVPTLPNGLTQLQMDLMSLQGGFLTHLPNPLPPGLNVLSAATNGLEELPQLPDQLISLNVSENQLTRLPALPDGLSSLFAHTNRLTELPALPAGLYNLDIHQNQLRELPLPLPPNLQFRVAYLEGNPWSIPYVRLLERIPEIEAELGYGRNVQEETQRRIRQVLTTELRQANTRRRGRNVSAVQQTLAQTTLPSSGVLNTITSFLSGKTGSSKQQALKLREEATRPNGGPGAQGGGRKRKIKTARKRKNRKS